MERIFTFKNLMILLIAYLTTSILVFLILELTKTIENNVLKALIYSVFFAIVIFISLIDISPSKSQLASGKNLLRYSMLCKKCGWEWMSHSTSKGIHPVQCPKCGNSKKSMVELVGWRKFDMASSKDKDLRHFFQ